MIAREELNRGAARPRSLLDLFEATAARSGSRTATQQKRDGRWVNTSWAELARRARDVADGLASLGVQKGDRVAIIGETTTDWIVADVGIMGAAAVVVPIYQSNKAPDCQYILGDAGARFIFCDSEAQVAKIRQVRAKLPKLEGIIRFTGPAADGFERTMGELEAAGARLAERRTRARTPPGWSRCRSPSRRASSTPPARPATRRASSSPTGTGSTRRRRSQSINIIREDDLVLCFLPMAHSFAKVIEAVWFSLRRHRRLRRVDREDRGQCGRGAADGDAFGAAHLREGLRRGGVEGARPPGLKGKLFAWALQSLDAHVARSSAESKRGRRHRPRGGQTPRLPEDRRRPEGAVRRPHAALRVGRRAALAADRLVLPDGRHRHPRGLRPHRDRRRHLRQPARASTRSAPSARRCPAPRCRIAEDGEILIRGRRRHEGVLPQPRGDGRGARRTAGSTPATSAQIDRDGFLRITDRKKDIIVTAGGKNVAPQNLENDLKTDPLISQVMVHGDKRKFLSALVTLNEENVRKWAQRARHHVRRRRSTRTRRVRARGAGGGRRAQREAGELLDHQEVRDPAAATSRRRRAS